MATTATTNLMSLNTQPPKSSSLRQANTQRQQYQYKNNSADKSFDKVFDKYNEAQSSMYDDVKDMSSDNVQDTQDPAAAAVTKSAQGKSKNTQDAPQKETQSVEKVTEAEEIEDTVDPKKITVMNLFVPFGMDSQNLNTDVDISENDSPNLMTILPQGANDKSQDMLNLLAGRTWKINPQNQVGNQSDGQNIQIFNDDLSLQLGNQQNQVQNTALTENNPLPLQDLNVQRNFMETTPQVPLNNVNSIETTEGFNNLADLIPADVKATENLNLISNDSVNVNVNVNVNAELPLQNLNANSNLPQAEQQNIPSTNSDVVDEVLSQLNNEQLSKGNVTIDQPAVSTKQEPLNINNQSNAQSMQQPQIQSTLQTGTQVNQNSSISTQQTNISVEEQSQFVSNNQAPVQNAEQPVHQPQQVVYQAQQTRNQPSAQIETVEMPQVQAAVAESQLNVVTRQQPLQTNPMDLVNAEGRLDQSQTVNPSQQTLQQQSQNQNQQQQQNFQSQLQQAATPEAEVSANAPQQAPTENFAAHFAAVNNTNNNEPINVSSEQPIEQTDQTARQENITTQIVEHARMIRNAQNTEMVIQLKPEHLGELTLRVSAATNGSVNVTFHSENAQVRAMLENTLVQLKQELSNQGLKVENVQVSAHLSDGGMMNGRGQQAWEQNQRSNNISRIGRIGRTEGGGLTAAEEEEIISTATPQNVVTSDSVDYRV